MRDRNGGLYGMGSMEELGGLEKGGIVTRIHCVRKSIFSIKEKKCASFYETKLLCFQAMVPKI